MLASEFWIDDDFSGVSKRAEESLLRLSKIVLDGKQPLMADNENDTRIASFKIEPMTSMLPH